jgi:KaiC/GvpD/RAD55 family RecA-like ATPase
MQGLASSGIPALDKLLSDGYPDRSAVLLIGPPGVGKEALTYKFIGSGSIQGDFCFFVTKRSVSEVQKDAKAFGFESGLGVTRWMANSGGDMRFNIDDLAGVSYNIKETLKENAKNRMRIVFDALSSILMLNPAEAVYRFLTQLFVEIKTYDAVLIVTLEEGMHPPQVHVAMQELFDGVIEMKLFEDGMKILPILRIRKMIGQSPRPEYYNFAYSRDKGLEISTYAY